MKKTLLLNSTYEVLQFIPEKRAFKLLYKDKVDVISSWDEQIKFGPEIIEHPAILRLKIEVKRRYVACAFNRTALIKRDKSSCQYCSIKLTGIEITIDHIVPKFLGGKNTFTNCVISCKGCNTKKANKTLEGSGLKLIKQPTHPSFNSSYLSEKTEWHKDWDDFVSYS